MSKNIIESGLEVAEQKELTGAEVVYGMDLLDLLNEIPETIFNDYVEMSCCCMCLDRDDLECECVRRKEERDGKKQCITSSLEVTLSDAIELVQKVADTIIEDLKKKSFICNCPPEKRTREDEILKVADLGSSEDIDQDKDKTTKLIYSLDLAELRDDCFKKINAELGQNQLCCQECGGYIDDSKCQCVKLLEKRSGKEECFMSASIVESEWACQKIKEIVSETVRLIKEKSFTCPCLPIKQEDRTNK